MSACACKPGQVSEVWLAGSPAGLWGPAALRMMLWGIVLAGVEIVANYSGLDDAQGQRGMVQHATCTRHAAAQAACMACHGKKLLAQLGQDDLYPVDADGCLLQQGKVAGFWSL